MPSAFRSTLSPLLLIAVASCAYDNAFPGAGTASATSGPSGGGGDGGGGSTTGGDGGDGGAAGDAGSRGGGCDPVDPIVVDSPPPGCCSSCMPSTCPDALDACFADPYCKGLLQCDFDCFFGCPTGYWETCTAPYMSGLGLRDAFWACKNTGACSTCDFFCACPNGLADCDGLIFTFCEASLTSDTTCASCDNACADGFACAGGQYCACTTDAACQKGDMGVCTCGACSCGPTLSVECSAGQACGPNGTCVP